MKAYRIESGIALFVNINETTSRVELTHMPLRFGAYECVASAWGGVSSVHVAPRTSRSRGVLKYIIFKPTAKRAFGARKAQRIIPDVAPKRMNSDGRPRRRGRSNAWLAEGDGSCTFACDMLWGRRNARLRRRIGRPTHFPKRRSAAIISVPGCASCATKGPLRLSELCGGSQPTPGRTGLIFCQDLIRQRAV